MRHREHLVPLYFHLGGLGAGAYALAALVTIAPEEGSAAVARLGFLLAPPVLALCGALLTVHLTRPARFWRVLTRFKWYSPISVGAWGLVALSAVSVLTAVGVLSGGLVPGPGRLGSMLVVVGGGLAWFVCAYTGVLLAASSRPLWCATPLLGAVFCVTGLATGASLLRLLSGPGGVPAPAVGRLETMAAALLLLAAGLWVHLERRLSRVTSPEGPVGWRLRRRPYGYLYWGGLALGFLVPALLLGRGGGAATLGALLALAASGGPRAAVFLAGERG